MILDGLELAALAWLLTYAVHSTLLLGTAWLVTSRRFLRSPRAKEIVWKTALVGGLFTASMQTALQRDPASGRWSIADATHSIEHARGQASLARMTSDVPSPVAEEGTTTEAFGPAAGRMNGPSSGSALAAGDSTPPTAAGSAAGRFPSTKAWTEWALLGWAVGGVVLLSLLLVAYRRLRLGLSGGQLVTEGSAFEELAALRERAGVRRQVQLMVSPQLEAPVALGTFAPQICIPPRALDEMPRGLQSSMLAHELAHVVRLDPFWLEVSRVMETLFFFQPLNRLARRRLGESAEFLCDDWAVRQTGDALGLASCLAEVAQWIVGGDKPLPACAMADLRSPLGERIERLLDEAPREERGAGWVPLAGATVLSATVMIAPGFGSATDSASRFDALETADPRAPVEVVDVVPAEPSTPDAQTPDAGGTRTPDAGETRMPDTGETLSRLWNVVGTELDGLEDEIASLREEATRRVVNPAALERLAGIEDRAAELRDKEKRIEGLLALLRTHAAEDAR